MCTSCREEHPKVVSFNQTVRLFFRYTGSFT